MSTDQISQVQKNIDFILDEVSKRGWEDRVLDIDQFSILRKQKQIRDAQVAALYEHYFLPGRHEFEWQILSDIAHTVVSASVVDFIGASIAGGVIGNAAYDLLKKLFLYASEQYEHKLGNRAKEHAKSFRQIGLDSEKLKLFFEKKHKARIEEIEKETKLPREKIYPLIKLAGFTHHRRKSPCYWEVPK